MGKSNNNLPTDARNVLATLAPRPNPAIDAAQIVFATSAPHRSQSMFVKAYLHSGERAFRPASQISVGPNFFWSSRSS
jgi:hypothetical protein